MNNHCDLHNVTYGTSYGECPMCSANWVSAVAYTTQVESNVSHNPIELKLVEIVDRLDKVITLLNYLTKV